MRDAVDVIVVGAGLAGLAATRGLAGRGHRVLLVDVKSRVDRPVHTTGIFVRRTLESFAIPERCLGPAVRRVVLHSPTGREVVLESERDEFRVGRMGVLYTELLAKCIALGAEWYPGVRYVSSGAERGGSAVWLERGGRRWRVRTRLVVGADGAVSRVARNLGLDANDEFIVGVEEVFEGTVLGDGPALHCYVDPGLAPGYIGWLVDDGEQTHVGVAGYADRFDAGTSLSRLRERLEERWKLSRLRRTDRRGGRIPVNGILRRIGNRQGLLIGDAAGAVSPLTAGGLDPCLRLTRRAVDIGDAYLRGESVSVLDEYSGEPYRRHFHRRRLLRALMRRLESRWCAELVVLMCAGPIRPVASRIFFGRGSFPDLAAPSSARCGPDPLVSGDEPHPAARALEARPAGG